MPRRKRLLNALLIAGSLTAACSIAFAAYKARPWSPKARENYQAVQTSQGLTIAADPLFRDNLASQVFDKTDIVTRGIMPVAVIVFNDNDFPVEINGASVELILDEQHLLTLAPEQFVPALFKKGASKLGGLNPLPRGASVDNTNADAQEDFDHKFLANRTVAPRTVAGGFLYFRVPQTPTLPGQVSLATLYVPEIIRSDNNKRFMYFEIDLKAAVDVAK
jgi:hypothetical protein